VQGGSQGATIDMNGNTAVIIGVASPQEPPQGQHWIYKPMRAAATAGQVGQVFGVALDDQNPPNIYLTATAAFGLHTEQNNWMQGMWGQNGGPGTVWRLDAASGYRNAQPFADLRVNGRPNTAASLGNIAYDKINRQFFVTDMETGLIHRVGLGGQDGGTFDHGTIGRQQFLDAESRQQGSLPPIPFDPSSTARLQDCPAQFDRTPECWNVAASGRRVWGIGVRRDPMGQGARLYYGVWSGPDFGNASWAQLSDEEKRNSVWSVRLGPDGSFDPSDIRREFIMPDFFNAPQDIERAGFSHPVSDIAFAECSERPVMLVSERGGMRNLGLTSENAFATPGEARTLRYELDQNGTWRAVGRYDVGNNDRQQQGAPFIRANCAGGAAFGPGVDNGQQQPGQPPQNGSGPDQFVWITGDYLCSPIGPCRLPGQEAQIQQAAQGQQGPQPDPSHVHGIQGHSADLISEVAPQTAYGAAPQGQSSQALENAYLVDVDTIIGPQGNVIEQELMRNDATQVGDIAIFQICAPPPPPPPPAQAGMPWVAPAFLIPPPPTGFVVPGHEANFSHAQWSSHGTRTSHFRYGSHNPAWSHQRWRSHYTLWSHNPRQSHNREWSHNRYESHNRWLSTGHDERRSHVQYRSHSTRLSHNPRISQPHDIRISTGHDRRLSWHNPRISQGHNDYISKGHNQQLSQGHDPRRSQGHNQQLSQGHSTERSQGHNPLVSSPTHNPLASRGHNPQISFGGAHSTQQSQAHNPVASRGHNPQLSQGHNAIVSRGQHNPVQSAGTHNPVASRGTPHNPAISQGGVHNPQQSQAHNPVQSRGGPAHNPVVSRNQPPHNTQVSQGHNPVASRGHNPQISQGHNQQQSQGHNSVMSRGQHNPVQSAGTHNPVASTGNTHRPPLSPGHNQIQSRGPAHNAVVSRGGTPHTPQMSHNPVQSRGAHNPVQSRGPVHNPVQSRGPVHNAIQSRGPVHNAVQSRGPVHSQAASRGNNPRVNQPRIQQPRVQQPRFQQPRVQQPRFQPRQQPRFQPRQQPRVQQPRVQQPRMQQPRMQQPRVQQRAPVRQAPQRGRPVR
jgi:hypothetical protein